MLTLLVLASLYFLPTIVASHRGHGVAGILLLNLLFGWTGIVWFGLLLWALLATPPWRYFPMPYQAAMYDRRYL